MSPFAPLRREAAIDLHDARVGVLGCGSVGSHAAWLLAANGVQLKLLDRDRIEPGNLRRHVVGRGTVGQPKAAAVADFLADRFDHFFRHAAGFDVLEEPGRFEDWLCGLDLLVVAVDAESPKHLADAFCRARGLPAIYGGVYGAGWAAEMLRIEPSGPCYGCAAKSLGRVGVEIDPPAGYSVPIESGWTAADLSCIQPTAALLARLALARLQHDRGQTEPLAEWPGCAWRLPLRAVPDWLAEPWRRIDLAITRQPGCLSCGETS